MKRSAHDRADLQKACPGLGVDWIRAIPKGLKGSSVECLGRSQSARWRKLKGACVRSDKQPLSFADQVQRLLDRGLQGDPAVMLDRLASVNYYRLSGYL